MTFAKQAAALAALRPQKKARSRKGQNAADQATASAKPDSCDR